MRQDFAQRCRDMLRAARTAALQEQLRLWAVELDQPEGDHVPPATLSQEPPRGAQPAQGGREGAINWRRL